MKKTITTLIAALGLTVNTFAGGLLTNTNQNAAFVRNPARDASTQIDAAYSNPAGLAKLDAGFHLSITNQTAWQTRTITSTFAPFAGNGGSATKVYKGETTAPFIPSFQAAYKWDKLTLSANAAIVGGGGSVKFSEGLPSFEAPTSIAPILMAAANPAIAGYSLSSQLTGSQITYGIQAGATYEFTPWLAAYAGARVNFVKNSYEGYSQEVKIGVGGNLLLATTLVPAASPLYPLISDKDLNCKQSATGYTPILGLNLSLGDLNIGARYEFRTAVTLKNKTEINSSGIADYDNGAKSRADIPALITLGASYKFCDKVTLSAGYHHFFDKQAKMAHDKQQYIDHGMNEYLGGVEWQINRIFLVSAGVQHTKSGVTGQYQSDMSFSLTSTTYCFGGAVNLTPKIRLNAGYMITDYNDFTKQWTDYANLHSLVALFPATPGTDNFMRTSNTVGIGIDIKF